MNQHPASLWQRYLHWLDDYLNERRQAVDWQSGGPRSILLLVSAMGIAFSALLYVGGNHQTGFHSLQDVGDLAPPAIWANVTFLGDTIFALCILAILAWRYPSAVWLGLLAAVLASVVNTWMKKTFGTARPPGVFTQEEITIIGIAAKKTAFPSGHTATAFALASVLFLVARQRWLQCAVLAAAVLVALSRVFVGVHWPVDLGVGAAVGSLGVWIASWQHNRTNKRVGPIVHLLLLALLVAACLAALWHTGGYPRAYWLSITAGISGLMVLIWGYVILPWKALKP